MPREKDLVRPVREVHAYLHCYRSSTKSSRSYVAQCHCGASLKKRSAFVCQKDKTHVFCEACVKSLLGSNFAKTRGKKLRGHRVCPVPGCAPRSSVRTFCTCRHCAEDRGNDDAGAAEATATDPTADTIRIAIDIDSKHDKDGSGSGDDGELSAASDSLKLPGSKVKTIPEDGKTFLNAACCKVQTAKQRAALVRQLSASFFSRLGGGLDYTATVLLLMINFLFIMVAALLDDPTTPLEVAQALKKICLAPLKRAAENVGARSLWALILGESGHGKSTLAGALFKRHAPRDPHYLEQLCERFGVPVDIPMASASTPVPARARRWQLRFDLEGKVAAGTSVYLQLGVIDSKSKTTLPHSFVEANGSLHCLQVTTDKDLYKRSPEHTEKTHRLFSIGTSFFRLWWNDDGTCCLQVLARTLADKSLITMGAGSSGERLPLDERDIDKANFVGFARSGSSQEPRKLSYSCRRATAARFALVLVEGKGKSAEDAPGHLELYVDSVDGPRVGVGKLKKGNVDALVVASSPSSVQAATFCPIFMVNSKESREPQSGGSSGAEALSKIRAQFCRTESWNKQPLPPLEYEKFKEFDTQRGIAPCGKQHRYTTIVAEALRSCGPTDTPALTVEWRDASSLWSLIKKGLHLHAEPMPPTPLSTDEDSPSAQVIKERKLVGGEIAASFGRDCNHPDYRRLRTLEQTPADLTLPVDMVDRLGKREIFEVYSTASEGVLLGLRIAGIMTATAFPGLLCTPLELEATGVRRLPAITFNLPTRLPKGLDEMVVISTPGAKTDRDLPPFEQRLVNESANIDVDTALLVAKERAMTHGTVGDQLRRGGSGGTSSTVWHNYLHRSMPFVAVCNPDKEMEEDPDHIQEGARIVAETLWTLAEETLPGAGDADLDAESVSTSRVEDCKQRTLCTGGSFTNPDAAWLGVLWEQLPLLTTASRTERLLRIVEAFRAELPALLEVLNPAVALAELNNIPLDIKDLCWRHAGQQIIARLKRLHYESETLPGLSGNDPGKGLWLAQQNIAAGIASQQASGILERAAGIVARVTTLPALVTNRFFELNRNQKVKAALSSVGSKKQAEAFLSYWAKCADPEDSGPLGNVLVGDLVAKAAQALAEQAKSGEGNTATLYDVLIAFVEGASRRHADSFLNLEPPPGLGEEELKCWNTLIENFHCLFPMHARMKLRVVVHKICDEMLSGDEKKSEHIKSVCNVTGRLLAGLFLVDPLPLNPDSKAREPAPFKFAYLGQRIEQLAAAGNATTGGWPWPADLGEKFTVAGRPTGSTFASRGTRSGPSNPALANEILEGAGPDAPPGLHNCVSRYLRDAMGTIGIGISSKISTQFMEICASDIRTLSRPRTNLAQYFGPALAPLVRAHCAVKAITTALTKLQAQLRDERQQADISEVAVGGARAEAAAPLLARAYEAAGREEEGAAIRRAYGLPAATSRASNL
eukprot:tig00000189_g14327.t1